MWIFGWLRLFDLYHQVRLRPNFGGIGEDLRACLMIILIRKRTAGAGVGFNQNPMASFAQRHHTARNQTNSRFVIFDFFRDADDHLGRSVLGDSGGAGACDCAVIRFGPRPWQSTRANSVCRPREVLVSLKTFQSLRGIRAPFSIRLAVQVSLADQRLLDLFVSIGRGRTWDERRLFFGPCTSVICISALSISPPYTWALVFGLLE